MVYVRVERRLLYVFEDKYLGRRGFHVIWWGLWSKSGGQILRG